MSSNKKRGRKSSENKNDSTISVYNSALESLPSSPAISLLSENDRTMSESGSQFTSPIAAGTPLASAAASAQLIAGEKQLGHAGKKDLLNRFDAAEDSNGDTSSFIDLSTLTLDTTSDSESQHSVSVYSITSTPEKMNISFPTRNNDTLEEIIVISSEDESTINRSEDDTETTDTTYEKGNTVVSNKQDQTTPDDTISTDVDNIKVYDSIEEFDKNLPPTVSLLTNEFGSKVYIVGTAHFSRESQDDVSVTIRNVRPDIVMIELCAARVHLLSLDEKTLLEEAKHINLAKIRKITKSNGLMSGLCYILMLNMSAKITRDLGMAPGGEFRRALEEIHRLPNPVLHLGDRAINITLKRAFNGLSFWQTVKIVCKLLFSNKTITKEDVEKCKQKDLLEELMEQMAGEYPEFRDVFVSERDLYLCHSLTLAAMPTETLPNGKPKPVNVVGVVGIGHSAGIARNWGKVDESKLPEILTIPPVSLSNRIFKTTVRYGFLGLVGYGIFRLLRPKIPNLL